MGRLRVGFALVLMLVLFVCLDAGGAMGQEKAEEATKAETGPEVVERSAKLFWFHILEQYRFRSAGSFSNSSVYSDSESDHDLRLYLGGGLRDRKDRFAANLALGLWMDMDGQAESGDDTVFSSTYDAASDAWLSDVWFDVYSLYGEYHSDKVMQLVRLGRQTAGHGRPVAYDGLSLELRPVPKYLDFFMFGGRTVHFFEKDADLFEDWLGSAGLVIRPVDWLRLELDYRLYAEADDSLSNDILDHSYGLAAWYRPVEGVYLKLYGRGLNHAFAHIGGAMRFHYLKHDLGLDLKADSQLVELWEVNELDNPFFAILGESRPHTRWLVDAWKGFATAAGTYTIHAGWNARAVHGDETEFNRNNNRLYLLFQAADIGVKGPFIDLVVEYHWGETLAGTEDGLLTLGGSAGYKANFKTQFLKAEAGTYYQRFKYDYFQDVQEVEDVRTFFAGITYKPAKWLSIRGKYEYELFDRDLHTFYLTLTQTY